MLFDSSLRRELSRSFGGTLVVILTIVLTMMLIRTLAMAAGGSVSPQDVALLLAYSAIQYLPVMLALTLFISVVSTMTRLYRDSEMAIWLSSGVSLVRFLPALRGFAWPIMVLIAMLVLVAWPWTHRQSLSLRERYEQRSDLSRVAPGQFQTSRSGDRVFFIDNDADAKDSVVNGGGGIFILDSQPDRESVTTARTGRIIPSDSGRMLVLENGLRTDLTPSTGAKTISSFGEYRIRVGEAALTHLQDAPPTTRESWNLLMDPSPPARAELAWRLGIVLAAANFVLLGLGLASGGARKGGGWSLLSALLTFIVYFNLINLSQAWVSTGRYGMVTALFLLHGTTTIIALALLAWRVGGPVRWTPTWTMRAHRTPKTA